MAATHIALRRPTAQGKKHKMVFYRKDASGLTRVKATHFGQKGASDFTRHNDEGRKRLYLARHRPRENWNDPHSAGSLSRYVLWNKPTIKAGVNDYARRFGFKVL